MGAIDTSWFDAATWDQAAQDLFWRKLARTRQGQGRAAGAKAAHLWTTGDPALRAAARDLLREAARRHGVDPALLLARFDLDEGNLHPAEALFRREIAEDPLGGSGRGLALAKVLVRSADPRKQAEARTLFDAWHHADSHGLFGAWEQVAAKVLDFDDFATSAEALPSFYGRPGQEWVRDAVRTPDGAAVAVLDRSLRVQDLSPYVSGVQTPHAPRSLGRLDDLVLRYLASLGAFLGEVLVERFGGRWVRRRPTALSTVRVGRRELDPYRQAYEALFHERLPGELFEGLRPKRAAGTRKKKRQNR